MTRSQAALGLSWQRRCAADQPIDLPAVDFGVAKLLLLPAEAFVGFQLAAQKLRPDLFVAMAAYGDYGPGYIGTAVAYDEGGYETSPPASAVAPGVEGVLMGAIERLLDK